MIVTDASVWVSHLIAQEVHHAVSRQWLTAVVHSKTIIVAPALLLAEVGGAIARRTDDIALGRQAIQHILSTPTLRLVYTDAKLGLLAAELAAGRRLRGADAFYVAVAVQLKAPLVSWDNEHLSRIPGLVTAYTPFETG